MRQTKRTAVGGKLTAAKLLALCLTLALVATACGGDDESVDDPAVDAEEETTQNETPEDAADEESAVEMTTPRVALTSPTQPSFVNTRYGPIEFGSDFGLDMSDDAFTIFDSHSTATQTALSGRADIVGGSFISHVLVREAGQEFQVFCPFLSNDDFVLAGRNGVDSVEDLFDPETRVAVDSPGGAGAMIMNALLVANDAEGTVEDLPNTTILESSGLRTTAFASGDVDATVIHLPQFNQSLEEAEDGVIVASLWEDVPVYIKEAFGASSQWLDENSEAAAAFCASVIKANRELPQDFDTYIEAVETYVEEPPEASELEEVFELLQNGTLWPTDGGLSQEAVEFMVDLAVQSGLFESEPQQDLEGVVNRGILERAVELADEQG